MPQQIDINVNVLNILIEKFSEFEFGENMKIFRIVVLSIDIIMTR